MRISSLFLLFLLTKISTKRSRFYRFEFSSEIVSEMEPEIQRICGGRGGGSSLYDKNIIVSQKT